MLLCGDVNKSTYDDACRLLVGTEAFRVRALDKMCRAAVEAMRSLAADDTLKPLVDFRARDGDGGDLDSRKAALAKECPHLSGDERVRVERGGGRRTSWPRARRSSTATWTWPIPSPLAPLPAAREYDGDVDARRGFPLPIY